MNRAVKKLVLTVIAIFSMMLSAKILSLAGLYPTWEKALLAVVVCILAVRMADDAMRSIK